VKGTIVDIESLENQLAALKAAYHELAPSLTPSQATEHHRAIKAKMFEVQAAYVEGCKPMGDVMPMAARTFKNGADGRAVAMWQIGLGDHRDVKAADRALAVAMWNLLVDSEAK
jgi:hypothetical protein